LAENTGKAAWVLLPKPEENLDGMNILMPPPDKGDRLAHGLKSWIR